MAMEQQGQQEIQALKERHAQYQLKWRERSENEIATLQNQWIQDKKQLKADISLKELKIAELEV